MVIDDGWQRTDADAHLRNAVAPVAGHASLFGIGSTVDEVVAESKDLLGGKNSKPADEAAPRSARGNGCAAVASGSAQEPAEAGSSVPRREALLSALTPTTLASRLASLLARGWAALVRGAAHLEARLLNGLTLLLHASPPGGLVQRAFAFLAARTPLRGSLLRFYAAHRRAVVGSLGAGPRCQDRDELRLAHHLPGHCIAVADTIAPV